MDTKADFSATVAEYCASYSGGRVESRNMGDIVILLHASLLFDFMLLYEGAVASGNEKL